MTSVLRTFLQDQLRKKVDAHGLVIWDDPAQEYVGVADSVRPVDAGFARWQGSWFELRKQVEPSFSGDQPPRLVVYVPTNPPQEDPLAELRSAGTQYTLRLKTLVRHALSGQLTQSRLDEVGRKATTLEQAEMALAGGDDADVRLVSALGTADTNGLALRILSGEATSALDQHDLWSVAARDLERTFGVAAPPDRDELRPSAMRQLLLIELTDLIGELPQHLSAAPRPTAEQQSRTLGLLDTWRRDRDRVARYAEMAATAGTELGLGEWLAWQPALAHADCAVEIEQAAMAEALRLLSSGDFGQARQLADSRLQGSLWAREALPAPLEGAEYWGPRWRAVRAVAELRTRAAQPSPTGTVPDLLTWYVETGWHTDQAHRACELSLSELHTEGDLEPEIGRARSEYNAWLAQTLERFTSAIDATGYESGDLMLQGRIHQRFVADQDSLVAYIWVDALRYELGASLAEALERVCDEVELTPALAAAPTVTPIGMANLCPGADTDLAVGLSDGNQLVVRIGDEEIKGVSQRVELLRAAHGAVVDFTLNKVLEQGEARLARELEGKALVLVRSQEVDAAGESGMLAVAWPNFNLLLQQLVRAVARLGQAGVQRFVISADHGFVALSQALGTSRVVYAPAGGKGHLSRRSWVGMGASATSATLRVPLPATGVRSDLDLIVPRGLAVFATAGGRQFFHGGLSPEELVVPVIVARPRTPSGAETPVVAVAVSNDRITTGVFSARVTLQPSLFTPTLEVRVIARRKADGADVARIVAGDGFDPDSDIVALSGEAPAVLTMRVTQNLSEGDIVEVIVLDSRTDRRLAAATAHTEAPVIVEEDLG